MLLTAYLCWGLLAIVTLIQLRYHHTFLKVYRNEVPRIEEKNLPRAGIIMTLRGADPFLGDCLRGLFSQNYPGHEIRLILDSETDPAMQVVEKIRNELQPKNVSVEVLRDRSESCSLRMSSLLQGVAGLDDEVEVISWLDADTMPYGDWLRDLVAPLADSSVGAVSGIRWYLPQDSKMGTLSRHIWNAGAFLQMCAYRIGFGGSFVIRRSVYKECGLDEKWSKIMFEDTFTSNQVTMHGHDLRYAGAVTMLNTETTSFSGCLRFVVRQMYNCRLYHRAWKWVVIVGIAWMIALLANTGLLVWSAATQNWGILQGTALAWGIYGAVMTYMLLLSESHIQRHVKAQGLTPQRISLRLIPATVMAHVLLFMGLWYAWRTREIEWRGIRYRISGPDKVQRLNYEPFCPVTADEGDANSL